MTVERVHLEDWIEQRTRDWLDEDGRPLGEVSSRLYPADTIEVTCPYSGARRGKPMNETARLQVLAHRDAGLATFAAALPPDAVGADVLRVATAIVAAPFSNPRPVPTAVSAAYKTNLGFQQVLVSLALDTPALATTPARDLPDPATLLAALEAGRWLVGKRQACAGSPADIALAWEVMCGRRAPPDVAPFPIGDGVWAGAATGLAVALVLATQERLMRGERQGLVGFGTVDADPSRWPLGARLWNRRPASWLLAAATRPDRAAAQVRRLYVRVPEAVEWFLAHAEGGHAELEAVFWEAADKLPSRQDTRSTFSCTASPPGIRTSTES